jgi:ribosomal protein L37AE/L43A
MPFTKCAPGMGTKPRFVRVERADDVECPACGDSMPVARLSLGYDFCLSCSNEVPKVANQPMHKQAYGYTHNPANLKENCYSTHK